MKYIISILLFLGLAFTGYSQVPVKLSNIEQCKDDNGTPFDLTDDTPIDSCWLLTNADGTLEYITHSEFVTMVGNVALGDDIGIIHVANNTAEISTSGLPVGRRVTIKSTGATYVVQSDSIEGYEVDAVAVIPVYPNYAVLQPSNGEYNLKWWGISGDSTDVTPVFQKAVDFAANKGSLIIPEGSWAIEPYLPGKAFAVHIPSNSHIIGRKGAVIMFADTVNVNDTFNVSQNRWDIVSGTGIDRRYYQLFNIGNLGDVENVIIEGLEFDGRNLHQEYRHAGGITWYNTVGGVEFDAQNYAIFIGEGVTSMVKNILVKDCFVHDMFGDGVSSYYATDVSYNNIKIRDALRQGVGVSTNCSNIQISKIKQLPDETVTVQGGQTIHMEPSGTIYNVNISDSYTYGLSTADVDGLTVTNCNIDSSGVNFTASSNVTFSGNNIYNGGINAINLGEDIRVIGNSINNPSGVGINLQFSISPERALINDNIVTSSDDGINLYYSTHSQIQNNAIKSGVIGIYTQDSDSTIVSGNNVYSTGTSMQFRGISDTLSQVYVTDNQVNSDINFNDVNYAYQDNIVGGTYTFSNTPQEISLNEEIHIIEKGSTGEPKLNIWREDDPLLTTEGIINWRMNATTERPFISVDGSTNSGSALAISGSSGQGMILDLDKGNGSNFEQFKVRIDRDGTPIDWLLMQKSGNFAQFDNSLSLGVGIQPTEKLHVNGTGLFEEAVYADSVNIGGGTTRSELTVDGTISLGFQTDSIVYTNGTNSFYSYMSDATTFTIGNGAGGDIVDFGLIGPPYAVQIKPSQYSVGITADNLPAYSFDGDVNSGLFAYGADDVGISVGGAWGLRATTTGILINSAKANLGIETDSDLMQLAADQLTVNGDVTVPADPYSSSWDGDLTVPVKDAIWDADQYINVKSFGAVGDGVTDDGPEIALAIAGMTATKRIIFFPEGNYLVDTPIDIDSSNVTFEGNGSTFSSTSSASAKNLFEFGQDVTNVTFRNIDFFSQYDQVYVGDAGLTSSNLRFIVSQTTGVDNITIENCTFTNAGNGIKINDIGNINIYNTEFHQCATSILGNNPSSVVIENIISNRDSITGGSSLTHHIYTNGGERVIVRNANFRGGEGNAFNLKHDTERKRDLTHLEDISLNNTGEIYLSNHHEVYIENLTVDSLGFVITSNTENENIHVNGLFIKANDLLSHVVVYQPTVSVDTVQSVRFTNVHSLSPIQFRMHKVKDFRVSNSTFINPKAITGGTPIPSFWVDSGNQPSGGHIENCTFIQDEVADDSQLIRLEEGNTVIKDCYFMNNSGTPFSYVIIPVTLTTKRVHIEDCRFEGVTRAVWVSADTDHFSVSNLWDVTNDAPMPDELYTLPNSASDNELRLGTYVSSDQGDYMLQSSGAAYFGGDVTVPADPYSSSWDGDLTVPVKDAIWDANLYVNIKDFGATGDGITDDGNEIQEAIDSADAQNKYVAFPKGEYLVSTEILIPDSITLKSFGGILIKDATSDQSLFNLINKKNVIIDGLNVVSNDASNFQILFDMDGAEDCAIINNIMELTVTPSYGETMHGILARGSKNILIRNNRLKHLQIKIGGATLGAEDIRIENNIIESPFNLAISSVTNGAAGGVLKDHYIIKNTIKNPASQGGIFLGGDGEAADPPVLMENIYIQNNTITGTWADPIDITTTLGINMRTADTTRNVFIQNNIIENDRSTTGNTIGIQIAGGDSTRVIYENFVIEDNKIGNMDKEGLIFGGGGVVNKNIKVIDNHFTKNRGVSIGGDELYGIELSGNVFDTVKNNAIVVGLNGLVEGFEITHNIVLEPFAVSQDAFVVNVPNSDALVGLRFKDNYINDGWDIGFDFNNTGVASEDWIVFHNTNYAATPYQGITESNTDNLYIIDGSLTGDRQIDLNGNQLTVYDNVFGNSVFRVENDRTGSGANAYVQLRNQDQSFNIILDGASSTLNIGAETAKSIVVETATTDNRIYVENGGQVGFGIVPTSQWHFSHTLNSSALFESTSASGVISLSLRNGAPQTWSIDNDGSNDDRFEINDVTGGTIPFRIIKTAPTNSLWINAAGETLINEASDQGAYALQVDGNGLFQDALEILNDGGTTYLDVYAGAGGASGIRTYSFTGTKASAGATAVDDYIGLWSARGHDGTSFSAGANAYIGIQAFETWGSGDTPTKITFATTPNGSSSSSDRLLIDHDGEVRLGTYITSDQGDYMLQSSGAAYFGGDVTIPADAYAAGWNGTQEAAPKDAIYNEMELKLDITAVTKELFKEAFSSSNAVTVADGTFGLAIPSSMNGMDLINVVAVVHDKGVTGTTDIQIRRRRAGTDADMLTTKVTIGDEWYAEDETVDTSNDDVQTGDMIYIDVDAVHSGTAPNGLSVSLVFQ